MLVAKIVFRNRVPEFWHLVRADKDGWVLVNYPLSVAYHKRQAKWVQLNDLYVDWIRNFKGA